jgi:hypothetical protein
MAVVRFNRFMIISGHSVVFCVAQVQERKHGRALELLNASIKDKTFDRNVTDALGFSIKMYVENWSDSSTGEADSSEKESPSDKIAKST